MTCLHEFMKSLMAANAEAALNKQQDENVKDDATTATADCDDSIASDNGSIRSTITTSNSGRLTIVTTETGRVIRRYSPNKLVQIVPDNAYMSAARRLRRNRKSVNSTYSSSSLGDKSPVSVLQTSVFDEAPMLPTKTFEVVSDNAMMSSSRRTQRKMATTTTTSKSLRSALREQIFDIAPKPPMKTRSGLQRDAPGRSGSFDSLRGSKLTSTRAERQERRQNRSLSAPDSSDEWKRHSYDDLIDSMNKKSLASLMENMNDTVSKQNQSWSSASSSTSSQYDDLDESTSHFDSDDEDAEDYIAYLQEKRNDVQGQGNMGGDMVDTIMKLSCRAAHTLTTKNNQVVDVQPAD